MSFDYDPFRHVELIQDDDDPHLWYWHCHSCGGDGNDPRRTHPQLEPLCRADRLVMSFFEHVRSSHERTPKELRAAGWSKE